MIRPKGLPDARSWNTILNRNIDTGDVCAAGVHYSARETASVSCG